MKDFLNKHDIALLVLLTSILSIVATLYCYFHGTILNYGDAESHINIAKRVVSSLTPGLAQLGGIWLPLPHLLMIPFVYFDPLWRTGLAGSIIGGISYVISAAYIYKLVNLLLGKRPTALVAYAVFVLNPNILYLQSTPMSELPLIAFFILSTYYFILFIKNDSNLAYLLSAAFFGFCATLSRYDGWFLVGFEMIALIIFFIRKKVSYKPIEGKTILFSTLAFFGIALWFLWDFLILGNPFYFSDSPFSAKAQQQEWLVKGQLPSYKNALSSFLYYLVTSWHIVGFFIFLFALLGVCIFWFDKTVRHKFLLFLLLFVPFLFYFTALFLGQAVIFIPDLTPPSYPWHLFNVRYGVMMIPFAAVFFSYFFHYLHKYFKYVLLSFFIVELLLFSIGKEQVLTFDDGQYGLSASKNIDATGWMIHHYTGGLVLLDDYARTLSIIKSGLPINKVIYIGNKPYWENSLRNPQKYATWVILQRNDAVWQALFATPIQQKKLYAYYKKVYTSPEILIFKLNNKASLLVKN
ncbi:MAG TPA: glycosyltransferase family 39 protein [Candidatus Saccharimonadales bacterium]|nr:glycosyltransferase family 39 protein [Candidatus Saccharimonadales bacterium]